MTGRGKLTILLTLKDRAEFTLRWMSYAERTHLPYRVLIADGGMGDEAGRILADQARFPHVDYEYRRFPPDVSYRQYYEKIDEALAQVSTPYVVMADNDDFLFAPVLEQSIRFLDAHPGYIASGGQNALFWVVPDPARPDERVYGDRVDWKCASHMRSNEAPTALERLRDQSLSITDSLFYCVKRIEEARRQFGLVRKLQLKDLFLMEILVHYLTIIAGPTKCFDGLFLARQHNSPGSSGIEHEHRFGDWLGRMLVDTWSTDFANVRDTIGAALAAADGIDQAEARDHVVQIYRHDAAPALLSDLLGEPTITLRMLSVLPAVRRLVAMPEESLLRRAARRLYRSIRWISLDAALGTQFLARPVPNAERDFRLVHDFLAKRP